LTLIDNFKEFLQQHAPVEVKGHRVVEAFERPPVIALGVENIYGVPVHDFLEGYKGQIIGVEIIANYTDRRHRLPTMGLKLKLGYTMLFGRGQPREGRRREADTYSYPMIVNGVVTPYVELLKRPDLVFNFYEYRTEIGDFEIAIDDAINLEQVMSGVAPVLITDKHGARYLEKIKEPDRLLELSQLVERLTVELQKYHTRIEEERRNAYMAITMADFYRKQLEDAQDKITKLSKEYFNIREEFDKAVGTLRSKLSQLEISTHEAKTLRELSDTYISQIETFTIRLTQLGERLKRLSESLELPSPAPSPTPEARATEEGGGAG